MEQTVEQKYKYAFCRERPEHRLPDDFAVRHPKMKLSQRAKIFSPFSALRGFEEAIDSKLERYVGRIEPSEEAREALDRTLSELAGRMKGRRADGEPIRVTAVVFVPCGDENHEAYGWGGRYETLTGPLWKLDPLVRKALWVGENVIELADLLSLAVEEPQGEDD
ncbi:MAG: hypothetical protein K6G17_02700 [Oscillospiraceae bacterium]|nr:hypothetical protein [Oscillospiraceae bacterium]